MASSARLMPSSSTANSDLARNTPIYSMEPATGSNNHASSSTSIMDDLIRNMYESSDNGGSKIVDEVWKEISGRKMDGGDGSAFDGEITLEEYLSKEEVRVPAGFGADPTVMNQQQQQNQQEGLAVEEGNQVLGFGDGSVESGGRGRGKKRPVLDPVDRAALQRQKRMIKNRESAARSRERKQVCCLIIFVYFFVYLFFYIFENLIVNELLI